MIPFIYSGAMWFYLEIIFFFIGIAIIGCQLYFRVITVRRTFIWVFALYCMPILTVAAWTFIGRPFFRRRIPMHRGEDTARIDGMLAKDPGDRRLTIARTLSVSG